jgi:hypothetical protein
MKAGIASTMKSTIRRDIDFFFTPPDVDPTLHEGTRRKHSTLYQLRREIQDCFIGHTVPEHLALDEPGRHRPFASAMVIFAGIDLMAKFCAGTVKGSSNQVKGSSSQRFKDFVQQYMPNMNVPQHSKGLYSVRNALVHSFGLYDEATKSRVIVVASCPKDPRKGSPVRRTRKRWELCVEHLFHAFVDTVCNFKQDVYSNRGLQENFVALFDNYGYLRITKADRV